jgi:hypothetical protein
MDVTYNGAFQVLVASERSEQGQGGEAATATWRVFPIWQIRQNLPESN